MLAGGVLALIYFHRNVIGPLDDMAVSAQRLIDGDLDVSVPKSNCREIDRIGESINDLSANIQEVLLLVWNFIHDSSIPLDRIIKDDTDEPLANDKNLLHKDLTLIRDKISAMEQLIASFDMYDVRIERDRAMAITDL
jgi:methyl-accepting chemotaxis protein